MKRALAIAFCLVPAGLAIITVELVSAAMPAAPAPICLEQQGGVRR
jgi:hypothetical protein